MRDFHTIEEAIDLGIIPHDYAELFSQLKKCKCGYPFIINTNATIMKCSNINCINALSGRAEVVYKKFGLVGYGQIELEKYIYTRGIKCMYDVLTMPPVEIEQTVNQWLDTPHPPAEILRMLRLPNLDVNCTKVFQDIHTFNELKIMIDNSSWKMYFNYFNHNFTSDDLKFRELTRAFERQPNTDFKLIKDIFKNRYSIEIQADSWEIFNEHLFEAGLYRVIQYQFNSNGSNSGSLAENVFITLLNYWSDIEKIFNRVECLVDNRQSLPIVITGDVVLAQNNHGDSFKEKEDFVSYLNDKTSSLGFKFTLGNAVQSTHFIIADYESTTQKYKKGLERNCLYNSMELVNAIDTLNANEKMKQETVDKKIILIKSIIDLTRKKGENNE